MIGGGQALNALHFAFLARHDSSFSFLLVGRVHKANLINPTYNMYDLLSLSLI